MLVKYRKQHAQGDQTTAAAMARLRSTRRLIGTVTAVDADEALEVAMREYNIPERDRRRTLVREGDQVAVLTTRSRL